MGINARINRIIGRQLNIYWRYAENVGTTTGILWEYGVDVWERHLLLVFTDASMHLDQLFRATLFQELAEID